MSYKVWAILPDDDRLHWVGQVGLVSDPNGATSSLARSSAEELMRSQHNKGRESGVMTLREVNEYMALTKTNDAIMTVRHKAAMLDTLSNELNATCNSMGELAIKVTVHPDQATELLGKLDAYTRIAQAIAGEIVKVQNTEVRS